MRRTDILLAAIPPALWGVAYAVAKPITQSFPPLFLASLCYALTALVLFRPSSAWQTPLWAIVFAGTLGAAIQSALVFTGIARVPASLATLVVQSQVPFAVLAAWAIGQERINGQRALGIVVAIAGIALLVGMPSSIGSVSGLLMIVAGTFSWGIAQGIIRAKGRDEGGPLMGAMSAVAAPQLLVLSLLLEEGQVASLMQATFLDWLGVFGFAMGGFVLAYTIWYGLLRKFRVDQIAPFILLMPLFGLVTAFALLGERPSATVYLGAIVLLAGLGLVVYASSDAGGAKCSDRNA